MPISFWAALSGAGSRKIKFATFEELDAWLKANMPDDSEESRLRAAMRSLEFELDWYTH
jgi:hypothetical protein